VVRCARLAAIMALLITGIAWPMFGQGIHRLKADSARWHEAERLRRDLERDSAGPAAVLRLAVLELAIGRAERARELLIVDSAESLWPDEVLAPLMADAGPSGRLL
jgi:hypothetical protein